MSYPTRDNLTSDVHVKKVNVCFYIAQCPVSWTAQSALHFPSPGRPVHSDTNSASLGSKDYSLTCPPLLKGPCIEIKYYADGIHSGLTPPG